MASSGLELEPGLSNLAAMRGAWTAQAAKRPTSAQGVISRFLCSSPAWGSVLTAWSLEPASDSVCVSLSLCPLPAHALSLSVSEKMNKY